MRAYEVVLGEAAMVGMQHCQVAPDLQCSHPPIVHPTLQKINLMHLL